MLEMYYKNSGHEVSIRVEGTEEVSALSNELSDKVKNDWFLPVLTMSLKSVTDAYNSNKANKDNDKS